MQALGSYVKEVLERCRFFQEWIDEGPPTIYWLSGFFFTQVSSPLPCAHGLADSKNIAGEGAATAELPLALVSA